MHAELTLEERLNQAGEEVRGAILAFEQIMQVMPNDLSSLESLWRAYSDVGDEAKALEYLFRLGEALEEQNDPDTAARVLSAMRGAGYTDPRIKNLEKSLSEISGEKAKTDTPSAPTLRTQVNMADELSFAWFMFQSEQLSREEYARVADVLSEMAATGNRGTLSVLHALESIQFPRLERLQEFVASTSGVPFVQLSAFDIGVDVARLLPLPFMAGRGVMPFEVMDRQHVLVAVLNPHDSALLAEIESGLARKAQLFLTSATSFDQALKTVSERLASAMHEPAL